MQASSSSSGVAEPVQEYLRRKKLKDAGVPLDRWRYQRHQQGVEGIVKEDGAPAAAAAASDVDNSERKTQFEQFWLSAITSELGDELDALRRVSVARQQQ